MEPGTIFDRRYMYMYYNVDFVLFSFYTCTDTTSKATVMKRRAKRLAQLYHLYVMKIMMMRPKNLSV